MAKVEVDISENSLDNSGDEECLISMVDDEPFGNAEHQNHLIRPTYLDENEEENSTYTFRDLPAGVTYKIVQMTSDSTNGIVTHNPSTGPLYVLPDCFETTAQSKVKKDNIKESSPRISRAIAKKRDEKRKATHNEVERRRRDKINNWITMLASLIPNTRQDNASKGGILSRACDYITELTGKQKRLDKLEEENEKLVQEILRLNQELTEIRRENVCLKSQFAESKVLDHRQKIENS